LFVSAFFREECLKILCNTVGHLRLRPDQIVGNFGARGII